MSVVASSFTGAVYEDDIAGDAVAITDRLAEMVPQILFFHTATMVSALLMVVFAAGLHRQLAAATRRPTACCPAVAAPGLLLVAVALLMGSGLTTEFVFGVGDPDLLVPETAAFFGHWIGTIPWLWGAAGLTALAVGRGRAPPRRLRRGGSADQPGPGRPDASASRVSPLQYMAGMVGPLWLTIAAIGLTDVAARPLRRHAMTRCWPRSPTSRLDFAD